MKPDDPNVYDVLNDDDEARGRRRELAALERQNELLAEANRIQRKVHGFRWTRVVAILALLGFGFVAIIWILGGLADMASN